MVEGFRVYNGTSAVGGDAGWWLPYMSNRPNTMPPQYALLNEKPEVATYSKQVVDLLAVLETNPPGSPESLQKICALSVTHIYIGQGQGTIGSGASALFSRKTLVESDRFTEIYHQDRVSIFKLNDGTCP